MPCSEAKLQANRQNARNSTGPRTTEGKARSSKNALKHGFCASGSSFTPLEDRAAYESFTTSILAGQLPGRIQPFLRAMGKAAMRRCMIDEIR